MKFASFFTETAKNKLGIDSKDIDVFTQLLCLWSEGKKSFFPLYFSCCLDSLVVLSDTNQDEENSKSKYILVKKTKHIKAAII